MTAAGDRSMRDGRAGAALFSRRPIGLFFSRHWISLAEPVRPSVRLSSCRCGWGLRNCIASRPIDWSEMPRSSVVPVRISYWGSAMRTDWFCIPLWLYAILVIDDEEFPLYRAIDYRGRICLVVFFSLFHLLDRVVFIYIFIYKPSSSVM